MKAFPFTKPVPLWASAAHWEEGHWLNISKQCICLSLSHLVTMPFFRAACSNFLYIHNLACLVLDTTLLSVPFHLLVVAVLSVQYLAKNVFGRYKLCFYSKKKINHWVVRWSTPSPLCVHKGAPSASRSTSAKRARRSLTLTVKR